MTSKYEDILNLPHHVSLNHPQMSMLERAAQFSPFAALSGHDAAIKESARITMDKIELDEYMKDKISNKLKKLLNNDDKDTYMTIQYFMYDKKRDGGMYISKTGVIKNVDMINNVLIMDDDSKIEVKNIFSITEA